MKYLIVQVFAVLALAASAALPTVSNVTISQGEDSRFARISYTLSAGDDAIVTLDILRNGVTIGGDRFNDALCGSVNCKVQAGKTYELTWDTYASYPDVVSVMPDVTAQVTVWPLSAPPEFEVLDLSGAGAARYYAKAKDVPGGIGDVRYKRSEMMLMRRIHANGKTFFMGSPNHELGRDPSDEYGHLVSFTNDWYLGVYPVTQGQYRHLMGMLPAKCAFTNAVDSPLRPVTGLTYDSLCGMYNENDKRSYQRGGTGALWQAKDATGFYQLDLPTDAQWEFSCRAGTGTAFGDGSTLGTDADGNPVAPASLADIAWYSGNSGDETHPVGLKSPNAFGLFDMHGNVCEMIFDGYGKVLGYNCRIDPFVSFNDGGQGVFRRGGSFALGAADCRSARRGARATEWHRLPDIPNDDCGFRYAQVIF